jgi:PKD repeat protein
MSALAALLALVQVSGTVTYEDRTYDATGFTGIIARPVRQAEVDVERVSDGTVLGSGTSDETGAFSIPVAAGETVRARVYARRASGPFNIAVRNNAGSNALYTAVTGSILTTGGSDSLPPLALTAAGAAPAFNLFDCAVRSFQVQATLDADFALAPIPPLTLYWEAGSSNGTFFSRTLNAVFLLGTSADPDPYDDDVVLHEIGHWVAFNYSKDDTLGGPHTVIDQLDPRTAWSEGWAHFWSSLVRRAFPAEYPAPQLHVDTFGAGASSFDVEGPSFPAQAVMATNELAVAAALWDIVDAGAEPFDALSGNETALWQAVDQRISAGTAHVTLEDFRAGLALEAPGIMAAVTGDSVSPGIFKARSIRYYPDASEPNGSAGAAGPLPLGAPGLTQHTFFPGADEDWYAVALVPGVASVQTLNLGDGGDTRLELYDTDGLTLLAANDDRSAGDPSSLLQRPIALAGTYYVRVVRTGVVVEHGYYDLLAQLLPNVPPSITSLTASALSGAAPLRVVFGAVVVEPEADYLEFAWDFDGDGRFDFSSLRGPEAAATYAEAGTFLARLRVTDFAGATATAALAITVTTRPASVALSQSVVGRTATFAAATDGIVPAAWAWDFESDGVVDRVSLSSASATHTYPLAGTWTARLVVHDASGRAYAAVSTPIPVATAPPAVGPFSATSGAIAYPCLLDATHGAAVRVEFDADGDGRFDLDLAAGAGSTGGTVDVRRAGAKTAFVRVTDASGVAAEAADAYTATAGGPRAWLVDPQAGDRLGGASVTLTAEASPAGRTKSLRFQYRTDSPAGPWTDIGEVVTEGAVASVAWNLAGLPAFTPLDLRVLVDGSMSSGDDAVTVVINPFVPTVLEAGGARERLIRLGRTTTAAHPAGVWAFVPCGAMLAPADRMLRIEPVPAPPPNGSALGRRLSGTAWRVSIDAAFDRPFLLRLPGASPDFEVHRFDEASGVWHRLFFPRVGLADGWTEAEAVAPGIYALFAPAGSGGDSCLASAPVPSPWFLLLGLLAWPRRR